MSESKKDEPEIDTRTEEEKKVAAQQAFDRIHDKWARDLSAAMHEAARLKSGPEEMHLILADHSASMFFEMLQFAGFLPMPMVPAALKEMDGLKSFVINTMNEGIGRFFRSQATSLIQRPH